MLSSGSNALQTTNKTNIITNNIDKTRLQGMKNDLIIIYTRATTYLTVITARNMLVGSAQGLTSPFPCIQLTRHTARYPAQYSTLKRTSLSSPTPEHLNHHLLLPSGDMIGQLHSQSLSTKALTNIPTTPTTWHPLMPSWSHKCHKTFHEGLLVYGINVYRPACSAVGRPIDTTAGRCHPHS